MSTTVPVTTHVTPQQAGGAHDQLHTDGRLDHPPTGTRVVQDAVHVGLAALSGILLTIGFALDPAKDTDTGAQLMEVVVDGPNRFFWASTISAFGLVLVAAVGLAVMRLVQGPGRVLATVGGMLLVLGGIAAGAGQFMYGAVVTVMAESGEDLAVMAAVQDSASDSLRAGLPFFIGFPATLLGVLVVSAALLRGRTTPLWVPAVLLVGVVAVFVLGDSAASSLGDVLLAAGFVGIAWALRQRVAGRAAG